MRLGLGLGLGCVVTYPQTPTAPPDPAFLLVESGGYLLLESGDKLLLG